MLSGSHSQSLSRGIHGKGKGKKSLESCFANSPSDIKNEFVNEMLELAKPFTSDDDFSSEVVPHDEHR